VPGEIAFNVTALILLLILRKRRLVPGQHFHLYLIAYGAFRFAHEFVRATPRIGHGLSGYHYAALACMILGIWRFVQRQGRRTAALATGAPVNRTEVLTP
jgi:phosphatidylglycerol:prolipoprotein diacylglycerol transferase